MTSFFFCTCTGSYLFILVFYKKKLRVIKEEYILLCPGHLFFYNKRLDACIYKAEACKCILLLDYFVVLTLEMFFLNRGVRARSWVPLRFTWLSSA